MQEFVWLKQYASLLNSLKAFKNVSPSHREHYESEIDWNYKEILTEVENNRYVEELRTRFI